MQYSIITSNLILFERVKPTEDNKELVSIRLRRNAIANDITVVLLGL